VDDSYALSDRFDKETGRVYLTGAEALVRLPLMQRHRDRRAGLSTAGFVTGYPGSPLGGLDSLLREQRAFLAERGVHFEPGTNEDLAATSIWGTQYLNKGPVTSHEDGVFGLWYGKGPGLDRSTDAMRTANYQGVARNGGVLALAGDDHEARSSLIAQQSDTLFVHMGIPVLSPASISECLAFGLAGWALSRFSSCWVGMICLNDIVDSAASVDLDSLDQAFSLPADVPAAPELGSRSGLGAALALEADIQTLRYPAAQAFVRANRLDRLVLESPRRRLGIVTAGKASLDVHDALARLGLSDERARELGISVYKLAMTWPLDPVGLLEFADGHEEILVIEAKSPVIEDQVSRLLWRLPAARRPNLVGKTDDSGTPLIKATGGVDAVAVARVLLGRLKQLTDDVDLLPSMPREALTLSPHAAQQGAATDLVRAPGFCSGCPHSTGTRVPAGTVALGGTGCHTMAIGLAAPGRETHLITHMGGEGAFWIGMAPFADNTHSFQNMGDGTYAHSGYLAIRAAIAANVDMTFKILLNGYISMTGGQSIPGGLSAQDVAAQVTAAGAGKVVVVSDDPSTYRRGPRFPAGVEVKQRRELIAVEEALQQGSGVSVLIYDQACSAELRRQRKRGTASDPDKRVFIHETVCEGCGDCNVESNCISVEPLETELGRKRTINQSSCNKDFSCVGGNCPSFVTLYGAKPRAARPDELTHDVDVAADLPVPGRSGADQPYNILIGGIGGSGVLTIGAILGMAAHLEGKAVTVLNESGLAQKNGAVESHVRMCNDPAAQMSARIPAGNADLVIGMDLVVVAGAGPMSRVDNARTSAILNDNVRPTIAFSGNPDLDFSAAPMVEALRRATGGRVEVVDADSVARMTLGDAIYANMFLLGYATQRGLLPVGLPALERAIELNAVSVPANRRAFDFGRRAAVDGPTAPGSPAPGSPALGPQSLGDAIASRRRFLVDYQNESYADRYVRTVEDVAKAERLKTPGSEDLANAVARALFKLMAYKDEYEVARLYTDPAFRARLAEEFEGNFRFKVNLAPQVLNKRDPTSHRARKWEIPSEVAMPVLRLISKGKRLRGTRLDLFGKTGHRRAERTRIVEYEGLLAEIVHGLTPGNHAVAVALASGPEAIRGFDTVKDASVAIAKEKERELLLEFRAGGRPMATTGALR
jgi:indolepyruvate ferredoxin oxidoreductase